MVISQLSSRTKKTQYTKKLNKRIKLISHIKRNFNFNFSLSRPNLNNSKDSFFLRLEGTYSKTLGTR